ncbi:HET-domain-containing protein [Trametes cingulata]|nr:HET-domain-containing protein [Trametes cingulata]
MPRFIDTHTGKFVWVPDARRARYAILSHTWRAEEDGGEQSYADVLKLHLEVSELSKSTADSDGSKNITSILSHPSLSDKIKDMCRVARAAGYTLVWIDSCCIDKSSSAELSEAINSMYDWYRLADVCYVYLADVSETDDTPGGNVRSLMCNSRWYTRGWTLQELIAPENVLFFTQSWRSFGTKSELADLLTEITGIDSAILTGKATLSSVSVSERMSWAAKRETTRVEDEAYALMGIFGVRMSPIYGERRNAFLRLQEEIIKTIPDQSIFSWGINCYDLAGEYYGRRPDGSTSFVSKSSFDEALVSSQPWGLLASSPAFFREEYTQGLHAMSPLSARAFATLLGRREDSLPPLQCTFTPEGVRLQLLCFDIARLPAYVTKEIYKAGMYVSHMRRLDYDEPTPDPMRYLALLRCGDGGRILALPLYPAARIGGERSPTENPGMLVATHKPSLKPSSSAWPFHAVCLSREFLEQLLADGATPQLRDVLVCRHWAPDQVDAVSDAVADRFPVSLDSVLNRISRSASPLRIDPICVYQLSRIFERASISQLEFSRMTEPETTQGRYGLSRAFFTLSYVEPSDNKARRVGHVIKVQVDIPDSLYSFRLQSELPNGQPYHKGAVLFVKNDMSVTMDHTAFIVDSSTLQKARTARGPPMRDASPGRGSDSGQRAAGYVNMPRMVEWKAPVRSEDPPFLRGVAEYTFYANPPVNRRVHEIDTVRTLRLTFEASERFDPPDQLVLSIDLSARFWGTAQATPAGESSDDLEGEDSIAGDASEPYDGSVLVRETSVPPGGPAEELLKENVTMRAQIEALVARVAAMEKQLAQLRPEVPPPATGAAEELLENVAMRAQNQPRVARLAAMEKQPVQVGPLNEPHGRRKRR